MSRKTKKINKILGIVQMVLLAAIAVALIVLIALGIRLLAGNKKEKSGQSAGTYTVVRELPEYSDGSLSFSA